MKAMELEDFPENLDIYRYYEAALSDVSGRFTVKPAVPSGQQME